jgi:spoIIIJ-associated protein
VEPRGKRSVVGSGKTVEDAITNGLAVLGVRRDQVDIDIIHPGSRGLLGIGAEDARVQLVVKAPPRVEPAPVPARPAPLPPEPEPVRSRPERAEPAARQVPTAPAARPEPVTPPRPASAEPAADVAPAEPAAEDLAEAGRDVLSRLLAAMGFQATVEASLVPELGDEGEEPPLVLNIRGDDLGILIGRRGETLAALQYLVRLMVSHRVKHWSDIIVDVESYRTRRRRALETLAARVADRVVSSGHTQALEPMPAYERRIVHIALRHHPLVTTHSVGVGDKRKVTILLKK